MRPRSVDDFLKRNRIPYTTLLHPPAFTAMHAAAASHTPGRCFAKTVVCFADDTPILAVVPAPLMVDLEQLRALMNAQAELPSVALGDPGDPIEYLKALSADADGREILAILLEVLESGFTHVVAGTSEELYVWPYFAEYPLDALTPQQLVELFTLLTAADYEDMKSYGSYTFFRVGIAPDGRWLFFLAGD